MEHIVNLIKHPCLNACKAEELLHAPCYGELPARVGRCVCAVCFGCVFVNVCVQMDVLFCVACVSLCEVV